MSAGTPVQPEQQAPEQQGVGLPPPMPPMPPVAGPPKRRRLKAWHWALIGGAIVIVLGIVIGALGSGSGHKSNRPTPVPTVAHHTLGEQVRIGDTWVMTVNSALLSAGSASFVPKTGNSFLVVDVSLQNVSAQSQNVSSLLQFTLKDASGQQYAESLTGLAGFGAIPPDGTVAAGDILRGQLAYEVPAAMHQFTLAFQPTMTSDKTLWAINNPQPGPTGNEQAPTATPQPTQAPTASRYKVGQQVQAGTDWQVTVNSVASNQGNDMFKPEAGNKFLVLDVTVKNISSQPQSVSSLMQFTLKDASGQKYTESLTGVIAAGGTSPDGTVEAGGVLRGQLAYEVPQSMHQFTFIFEPTFVLSEQYIWDITN